MKAEIFSIGTELLMGELADTNTSWIAARLAPLGVQLHWASIIGDDLARLSEALSRGIQRSDIIFTTGGLGPTQDDLTREAVAKALGETPVVQQEVVDALELYFQARGAAMPPQNIKQAHLIPSARFIPNRNGTAPGWWVERNGKIVICMPGPPREMQAIWEEQVAPELGKIAGDEVTLTRNIKTMGMSEGAVDEIVSEYFGRENPYLGIYSRADGIHLRIIARARNTAAAQELIQPVEEAIVARLGPYIWGYDDETPEQSTGRVLKERGLTLATMESCTGGFLANSITEAPDSAAYFKGGVVAYTDPVKIANGVPEAIIEKHGAVSQQTATAMALAIREKLGADFGIGITGVAGPSGQEGKPVGLAYLSVAGPVEVREMELRMPPRRVVIKRRVSNQALIELRKLLAAG
ncbi:MAG: competence/damage-inducible protein A [Dehalococcoidia bacterium]|nr:competence/damage-inducible protein A [Dehalococcoidia bacterium]